MGGDRSNLYYLGVGCLIAGIVLAVGLAAFLFFAYRWGQGVEEAMKDPERRRQQALEILGGDDLPDGYHAMVGLRVPYLMETAILTDDRSAPDAELPDLGERGLIYVAFRNFGQDREEMERFFSGEISDPEALARNNIDLDLGERLAHGRLEHPSGEIPWVTHRGEIGSVRAHGRHQGLVTLFQVDCSEDDYNRVGMWFGPEPGAPYAREAASEQDPTPPAGAELWKDSVADPEAVAAFLGHFRFCAP